ncbi:MAG: cell division protein FtsQ/DivIB [Lachnospiraceae bacterium]|nr:cell division protein FtsQ/DivIB [Lachnospiraceae bacterium]
MKKKKTLRNLILLSFLLGIAIAFYVISTRFQINAISVTGNVHYTEDEIIEYVTSDGYINNSLILSIKNKIFKIEPIPFVDKFEIEYLSNNKIAIVVYEKAMAGCTEYMGEYVYFDKDGIVLETSTKRLEDIPCVYGITFTSFTLHEQMQGSDIEKFKDVLIITQLLQKYDISIENIEFTEDEQLLLVTGDISILLGEENDMEVKIAELQNILPKLEGKKGILHMETFSKTDTYLRFETISEENKEEIKEE